MSYDLRCGATTGVSTTMRKVARSDDLSAGAKIVRVAISSK